MGRRGRWGANAATAATPSCCQTQIHRVVEKRTSGEGRDVYTSESATVLYIRGGAIAGRQGWVGHNINSSSQWGGGVVVVVRVNAMQQ